jgi:membrane dipeptidase
MRAPIILGHHDALFRLSLDGDLESFVEGGRAGHLDLPRAQVFDVVGGFYACWVANPRGDLDEIEPDPIDPDYAAVAVEAMVDDLYTLEEMAGGDLLVVRRRDDLELCLEVGAHAAILHFEGAEPIAEDLSNLELYYQRGLRSLGLVWSRPNAFGWGVPFLFPASPDTGPGLTSAGLELVKACNSLGIMLDLSHLNEAGFWEVARLSRHPLVATHSNVHQLCPSARNLTADQLKAIAASGGLVGVNFSSADLRDDGADEPDTDLELILEQLDYLAEELGVEHVALGTDFDGAVVPYDLDGVEYLPDLLEALSDRGWSEDDIERLGYLNWLRVLGDTWLP